MPFFVKRLSVGWCCWFGAGLVLSNLWDRPRPMLVDFHDEENQKRLFRMIMWHVKYPLRAFWLGYSRSKLRCLPLERKLGVKITCGDSKTTYMVPHLKKDTSSRRMYLVCNGKIPILRPI
ncbi:hypothetical protein TNCV_2334351 [Trichonephila clavipes]|nr:hypothetical protein TNCV_2334351 [Trichonephila clavipes]